MQNVDVDMGSKCSLKQCLDSGNVFAFGFYIYIYILLRSAPSRLSVHETHYLLTSKISGGQCFVVGPVHCSRDPKTSFFTQTFIKNGSHDTIHTFKNYFVILFSVFSFQFFSKISGIQTHP